MTIRTDNPAGKLHSLITAFYAAPHVIAPGGRPLHISERLARILSISSVDRQGLLEGLFQIHKLIDEVERSLAIREGINQTLYVEPLKRIRLAFMIVDMSVPSDSNHHPTLDIDLTSLAFAAELLSQYAPEKTVPDEELSQLLDDIKNLYEIILTSSLDLELKTLILNQLEFIRRAIHDYRIMGVTALREAVERVAGSYFVNESLINKEGEKEEVKGYKKFLSKFVSTVSFASNVTKLIDAAAKWLPLLTDGKDQ